MADSSLPEPLIGDPARQATDLHRGIVFQIWRSVEAWISLADDELLYLEGAEDYDVVAEESGTVVQTKAVAANITLRSKAVVEAMMNFWLVRSNHPKKRIRYRFITTSAIGAENGNPFDDGKAGLKVWQECAAKRDLTQAAKLQTFLTGDSSISPHLDTKGTNNFAAPDPTLLSFLKTASPEEVLEQFIAPMSWEVESVDEDVVRESVGLGLRAYGEHLRYRPQESMVALDRLYRIAAETAKKKQGRVLSRDDFRREFNDATSKLVSLTEFAALQAGANAIQQSVSPAAPDVTLMVPGLSPIRRALPALSVATIKRSSLGQQIADEMKKLGVMVIKGSSGMGKSTIAALAAAQVSADWVWVDLQDVPAGNIPQLIRGLASVFVEMPALKNLGLDNLNFNAADLLAVEVTLPAILRMARNRGGTVMITTQRDLPLRMMHKMALSDANIRTVPRLDENEIAEFCRLLGCPTTDLAQMLAKLVRLQTFGHPRLAHARLVGLQVGGWPRPKAEDLAGQPKEIVEEREVARQLLDDAPTGDKELLYRLSVATGPFRRDHAILVGQMAPVLEFPADSFARLVGPWIDALGTGYYRLSPLLHSAASDNWTPERIKTTRSNLAQAMLSGEEKTLLEASEILFQGILSEDEEAVTAVTIGLQSAPAESMRTIADQLSWLSMLGREPGTKIFKKNHFLNVLLRLLQFRIVTERTPVDVDTLCLTIDGEITELKDESGSHLRLMWVMTAVGYLQANIRPDLLLRYWAELLDLLPKTEIYKEIANVLKREAAQLSDMGSADFRSQFLLMILARQMDSVRLVAFARAVNALSSQPKEVALTSLKNLLFPLRLAVDRAWGRELEKTARNWTAVLENLEAFKLEIKVWEIPDLQAFVARAMAAIEDEYRGDPAKALVILEGVRKLPGIQKHLVEDQCAMVLFRAKQFPEALKIWQEILPTWPITPGSLDHIPLYACERAGKAAAQICDWTAAGGFFRHGQYLAKQFDEPLFAASYLADEAFAIWKSGSKPLGLEKLVEAVEAIELITIADEDEFQVHRVKKFMEQVVKWCRFDAGSSDEENAWEPHAGMCSQLEVNEKLKEIPAAPLDLMWFLLADIEVLIRGPGIVFDQAMVRVKRSSYAAVRSLMGRLVLRSAFSRRDFASLIDTISGLNQAISDVKTQIAIGKTVLEPDGFGQRLAAQTLEMVEEGIIGAFIALAENGKPLDTFVSDWKRAAENLPNQPAVSAFFAAVDRVLAMPEPEFARVQQNVSETLLARSAAAVRMCMESNLPLFVMFIGQAFLLGYVTQCSIRREIEDGLGNLVRTQWLLRNTFAAEFLTPRLTIPAIQSACNDGSRGLKLAARILLQAQFAVGITPPSDMVAEWQKLAAD